MGVSDRARDIILHTHTYILVYRHARTTHTLTNRHIHRLMGPSDELSPSGPGHFSQELYG